MNTGEQAEHHFTCPFCWETISMLLDLSVDRRQQYVEDCEVCCNPLLVTIVAVDGSLSSFDVASAND